MSHFVYILHSPTSDKYYIGQSAHPLRRLDFHNFIEKGFTARYRPWILAYTKECESKHNAIILEKEIKGWKNKDKIRKLVVGKTIL